MVSTTEATSSLLLAAGGLFTDFGIDEAMWDGCIEAALALLVFGVASAIMRTYRSKTSKNLKAKKLLASCDSPVVSTKTLAAPWRRTSAPSGNGSQSTPPGLR